MNFENVRLPPSIPLISKDFTPIDTLPKIKQLREKSPAAISTEIYPTWEKELMDQVDLRKPSKFEPIGFDYLDGSGNFCSGSIIVQNIKYKDKTYDMGFVLTARHCLKPLELLKYSNNIKTFNVLKLNVDVMDQTIGIPLGLFQKDKTFKLYSLYSLVDIETKKLMNQNKTSLNCKTPINPIFHNYNARDKKANIGKYAWQANKGSSGSTTITLGKDCITPTAMVFSNFEYSNGALEKSIFRDFTTNGNEITSTNVLYSSDEMSQIFTDQKTTDNNKAIIPQYNPLDFIKQTSVTLDLNGETISVYDSK